MRKLAFILVPLVLLGCGQEPAAPAVSGTPAFNYMNNPDNGNFRIFRYQGAMAACWTDPTTGLRACHATIPLGGGGEPDCGLQSDAPPADNQEVLTDVEALRIAVNASGRVWITVRDLNRAGDCFDAALVAEGWGTMRYTDNDALGTVVNNTNAWGFMASGTVTTPGGASLGYSGHARFRFNQSTAKVLSLQVNLH